MTGHTQDALAADETARVTDADRARQKQMRGYLTTDELYQLDNLPTRQGDDRP